MLQHKESWWACFASAAGSLLIFWVFWFYLVFHRWLGSNLRALLSPFLILSGLVFGFAAAVKISRERLINRGELLPMIAAVTGMFAAACEGFGFYGRIFGYFDHNTQLFWCIAAPLICVALGLPVYHIMRGRLRSGRMKITIKTQS
jgi:hypothetical protein